MDTRYSSYSFYGAARRKAQALGPTWLLSITKTTSILCHVGIVRSNRPLSGTTILYMFNIGGNRTHRVPDARIALTGCIISCPVLHTCYGRVYLYYEVCWY